MYRTRQYFTKGDFKELVKQLEEYVGENKVVLRDDIIENVHLFVDISTYFCRRKPKMDTSKT